ncbi:methyl-accepting chemotaxis protein [Paenibacillus turpanensis]|uniref:methyl-accepting chemotaxis protein n=1 Tax=Paenibacillus turpanensis TaxID=2689078 RepID=UPI00140B5DDF|nr:methyl-accepting chemotaxis protein [Paenibacillus turpanensis]
MKKVRSTKLKSLVLILPVTIAILLCIAALTFTKSKEVILDKTAYGMHQQLNGLTNQIEKDIQSHQKVAEALAQVVKTNLGRSDLASYQLQNEHLLDINSNTFGLGIFFEPKVQDPAATYFSTYTYRTNGNQKTSTQDYNDPSYDYHKQDWYTIVGSKGEKGTQYTLPYYDATTGITMLTTAVPILNDNQKFVGVATGDINLSTIQQMISEAKFGQSGWTFLLGADGTYLAGVEQEKIMKLKITEDENSSFQALGTKMLELKSGQELFEANGKQQHVYFSEVPSTGWLLGIVIPDEELMQPINRLMTAISLFSVIGILVLIAAIFLYANSITRQIKKLNRLSTAMSHGDFTQTVHADTVDELGVMALNFNDTTSNVRNMLQTVSQHAAHVSATSEHLQESAGESRIAAQSVSTVIQEIAAGSEAQLKSTEESARALEEMSVGIQRIAESSSLAAIATNEVSRQALTGSQLMNSAEEQMDIIRKSVIHASEMVRQLGERSMEINQIVEVITDISSQTNLLALNASIEAARAGEEGRGFAVVAGEVKKLAHQTSQSAGKIAELIRIIQNETLEAIRTIESGSSDVAQGTTMVNDAGQAFRDIQAKIDHIASQMEDISASSEQVSAGSQEVSAAVNELTNIAKLAADNTQNVAASAEEQEASMQEISESAKSLHLLMKELQCLIERFKH